MRSVVGRFLKDQSGATAVEYGLIIGIIGLGIVISLGSISDGLSAIFGNVAEPLK